MMENILNNNVLISNGNNTKMKMELNDLTNVCLQAYLDNNYENLEQVLKKNRKRKKQVLEDIKSLEAECVEGVYQAFEYRYQYIQTYNIMNKMLNLQDRKRSIQNDMIGVMNSFRRARDVIFFLYKNSNVRQCTMKRQMDISPSTLHDLLNALESIRCVEKIKISYYPVYNLTVDGRRYVDDNFSLFNEVRIIDKEELRDCQKSVFEQKTEKSKLLENNAIHEMKRYEYQYSTKNKKEECFLACKE